MQNKNIKNTVVFGGTGFLGKNLQQKEPNWIYVGSEVDLKSKKNINNFLKNNKIDRVINLAGNVGGIKHNVKNNLQMMQDNFEITTNVISVSMDLNIDKVATALSTCMLPDYSYNEIYTKPTEKDIFNGVPTKSNLGYAIAKQAAHAATMIARSEGFKYFTFTPSNLYGPWDNFNPETSHFIPALIDKALASSGKVVLYGNGTPLRQMLYVEDAAKIISLLIDTYDDEDTIFLASDENLSINYMANKVIDFINPELKIVYTNTYNGQYRKDVDNSKFKKTFPEFEFTPFSEGIKRTIEWRKNSAKKQ